jgi:tetraacyldisaccharide-1-P 4'-kinase
MLLAGIAKPKPFFDYLQTDKDEVIIFSDHHHLLDKSLADRLFFRNTKFSPHSNFGFSVGAKP